MFLTILNYKNINKNNNFEISYIFFKCPFKTSVFDHFIKTPFNNIKIDMLKIQIKIFEKQTKVYKTKKDKTEVLTHMQNVRVKHYKKNFVEIN